MTVKELKEILEKIPQDYEVHYEDLSDSTCDNTVNAEIVEICDTQKYIHIA